MGTQTQDLSRLLSSATLVFVGSVVASVSGLAERAIVGRLLDPAGYGEFAVALAIFTLGSTLGAAGFTQGVPRFMARFESRADVRGAWLTGLGLSLVVSGAITIALLAGTPLLVEHLFDAPEAAVLLPVFVLAIPLYVVFNIGMGAIRGQENTQYHVLVKQLIYPLLRIALIAGLLLLGWGLFGTALGYFVAIVVVAMLSYYCLGRLFPLRGEYTLHTREMTGFSAPLVVSTVMTVLITRTDTLMLGYFRSAAEVGIYNAAYPLAGSLAVVLGAFGYLYLPMASRIDSEDDRDVGRIYETTTKWLYLIVLPLFVTLIVFPHEIIAIVFGAEYAGGGFALAILAVGTFTNAAVGRNRETLSALGATVFILVSNVVAFAFNFAANVVLIPAYGFEGAAVASAGTYIVLNLVVYGALRSRFGITPFNRTSLRAFVLVPVVVIPLGYAFGALVPSTLPGIAAFGLLMVVIVAVAVAGVGGYEPEDLVLVEFIEEATGLQIPLIRRYIPDPSDGRLGTERGSRPPQE